MPGSVFQGLRRKLVLAFDVGTTCSGISYSILDPGQVPEIKGITKFPGQEYTNSSSKIPTIIYYDQTGKVRAVGAEATREGICEIAQEEQWIQAAWFKLHLRSKFGNGPHGRTIMNNIPPLPLNKTVVKVFADFLKYLFDCASSYIQMTHPNGDDLWKDVAGDIRFVLSHPNGWEGTEQVQMREAAVGAGLIPNTNSGHDRLSFVTEGEASLHFSIRNGLPSDVMNNGEGIVVVDAGGGTIDVSSYRKNISASEQNFEEIAVPQCHFHGSVFVAIRARIFLANFLLGSPFLDDIDHLVRIFDTSTKLRFNDEEVPQYVKFGSTRDNDPLYNIRFGQLKLSGSDVASFFQPSVDCIVSAILEQKNKGKHPTSYVVLLGGFSESAWVYTRVKAALMHSGLTLFVPDTHKNKAVSDGAISFYLDHVVRTRVSKFTYGCIGRTKFNAFDYNHLKRKATMVANADGEELIPGAFEVILPKDTQISESQEFKRIFHVVSESQDGLSPLPARDIVCYRGTIPNPKWVDEDPDNYTKICSIQVDNSHMPIHRYRTHGFRATGRTYYYGIEYYIILSFGLTELKAQVAWMVNGVENRTSANIIYDCIYD